MKALRTYLVNQMPQRIFPPGKIPSYSNYGFSVAGYIVERVSGEKFERYIPYGTPAQVAEFIAPFIEAGATTVNFIPFAGSDEAAIDAVAETREVIGRERAAARPVR